MLNNKNIEHIAADDIKIGDVVRMTKGEPDKPGYCVQVREVSYSRAEPGMIEPPSLRAYEREGWTVELVERPAPPLPTKPNSLGWVTVDGTRYLARLADGMWEVYDEDGRLGSAAPKRTLSGFEEAVLIPKELADKVMEWVDDEGGEWHAGGILQQIAAHLKGTRR